MAQALILDAEALNALAHARQRPALAERAHAVLQVARDERAVVRVPAPVLAEVCRSAALDAAVQRVLNGRGIGIVDLTPGTPALQRRAARRAQGVTERNMMRFVVGLISHQVTP